MMTSIDENLSRLFAAPVIGDLFHAYDSTQTRCILCICDSLYDYDATGSTSSITSSTTVTTTFLEDGGYADTVGIIEDPAGGHDHDTAGFGMSLYGYRYYKPDLGRWVNRDPIEEIGSPGARSFISWYARTLAIRATLHLASAMDRGNSPSVRLASLIRMLDDWDRIDWAYRGNPMLGLSYAGPNPLLFVANDSVNLLDYLGLVDASRRDPASVIGGLAGRLRRATRDARKQVEDAARQAGLPVDEAKQLRDLMPDRLLEEKLKQALRTALAECDIDPEKRDMVEDLLDILVEKLKSELFKIPDQEGDSLAEGMVPKEGGQYDST